VRLVSLAGGVAALAVASVLPERPLTAHMVQHLLIATVAPGLIALSAPVRLALARLPRRGRHALADAMHRTSALAHPAVAVGLAVTALLAFHLTPLFGAALGDPILHGLEHALLFWTGLLAWMAILGVDPLPSTPGGVGALAALTAWMLPMAAIGAVWTTAPGDRQAGGEVMWFGGLAVMGPAALAICVRALWLEEARQRRREAVR